jgi:hypothetical protein
VVEEMRTRAGIDPNNKLVDQIGTDSRINAVSNSRRGCDRGFAIMNCLLTWMVHTRAEVVELADTPS